MPLQEADLKSYDAYKKAMRATVSKITNTSKTKFWVYKDIKMVDLKGKQMKLPAFLLLVDDSKVRNAMRGKKLLCAGTCSLEQSRICLEPVKGKVPFALLKVSIPLLLGKPLYIPSGHEEDEGDEGVDDEDVQKRSSEPPARPSAAPELMVTWKRLYNQAQKVVAANPLRKEATSRAMAGIPDLLKAQNFSEAKKRLAALEQTLAASSATVPASSGAKDAAALKELWSKLVTRIKASGNQALIQAAREVSQKLGPLVSHGNVTEAQKLIGQLAGRLQQAKPVPTAAGTPYKGIVKYRQALLGFAQAKSEVRAQINALKSAILKLGPQEANFAGELAAALEQWNQDLADAVDEAMKASENQVSPATDAVKLKIRKYLSELASDPLVQKVEANPLGVKVTIRKTLVGALALIKDAMPA